MVIIAGNFAGQRPIVIAGDDGEPANFGTMENAREFVSSNQSMCLAACHMIVIVDLETGETDTF